MKVTTPATDVTKVDDSAAGATSAGGRPVPIKIRSQDGAASDAVDPRRRSRRPQRAGPARAGELPGPAASPRLRGPGWSVPARCPAAASTAATTKSKTCALGSNSTRMIDPATTPGSVPAMSTRASLPPVCPCRQYRYSAPGVGDHVVEQVGRRDRRAWRAEHADLKGQAAEPRRRCPRAWPGPRSRTRRSAPRPPSSPPPAPASR